LPERFLARADAVIRRQQVTGSVCASYVRVSELQVTDHMVAQSAAFGERQGVRSGMILIEMVSHSTGPQE